MTSFRKIIGGLLLAFLVEAPAWSQDAEIESAIREAGAGGTVGELKAQAAAQPPKTDDRQQLAVFYHKRGIAHHRLGSYAQAIEDLRAALDNNQPGRPVPDHWGERWRIQNDLASAYQARGDLFAAIDFWKQTSQEYDRKNLYLYHYSQLELMDCYGRLGRRTEADAARVEADATLTKLRELKSWPLYGLNAQDRNNYLNGLFFLRQGNHAEAERRLRASLDWAGKYVEAARKAFPEGHQERRIAELNTSSTTRLLADVLSTQGKYGEAEILARSGLREALRHNAFNTGAVSYGLVVLGWSRFQQGDVAGAEKYYRYALAALEGSGVAAHAIDLAGRRAALANALSVQGRWDEALKLFDERDKGLRSDAEQFKRYVSRHVTWAYALHRTGQSQRAAVMAQSSIAANLKRAVPDAVSIARWRGVRAMALDAGGRSAEALREFQQAIPELVRRDQDDSDADNGGYWRAFWQRVILEGYLDLLARRTRAPAAEDKEGSIGESFRIADLARGSTVQGAIAASAARAQLPDASLASLARREQDNVNRVGALNKLLGRLSSAAADERLNKVIADMQAEIGQLRKENGALRSELRSRYPEYAELIDPRPPGIDEVGKALAPGEALVSVYLGTDQSYVWTVVAGGPAAFRVVPLSREQVEADVRELRKTLDFGDGDPAQLRPFDLARAHKLYREFFEPDAGLWKNARVLNVIPHGALGQLPLALLVAAAPGGSGHDAYRDAQWLIGRIAVVQLPSASAFIALRRVHAGTADRQAFIGFGDPVFSTDAAKGAARGVVRSLNLRKPPDRTEEELRIAMRGGPAAQGPSAEPFLARAFSALNALPDTSEELKDIAAVLKADPARDVFVSGQATEKNVKRGLLQRRRVVVFATHGIAPGELTGLDQPALVLSNPALTGDTDNDGFLTMDEVLALKLDADWVVLSACNTASADGRGSEAVSGLGRAFFYAGARSLLVSNWPVETTSARLLTTGLFKRQAENPRLTRAEALRQSMLDLMQKKSASGFSYAHPAFWAPFSLVGDGGR